MYTISFKKNVVDMVINTPKYVDSTPGMKGVYGKLRVYMDEEISLNIEFRWSRSPDGKVPSVALQLQTIRIAGIDYHAHHPTCIYDWHEHRFKKMKDGDVIEDTINVGREFASLGELVDFSMNQWNISVRGSLGAALDLFHKGARNGEEK